MTTKTGILIANLGTPDAPTTPAVRRYLQEFLSDRRVIELSPLLWQPILHGFILRTRPRRTAALYQKIWTENGSPLLQYSLAITQSIQQAFTATSNNEIIVRLGMRYGKPSLATALAEFQQSRIDTLCVLPLYPQYSATTTASIFDVIMKELRQWRDVPELHFLKEYATDSHYIHAVSQSIRQHWQTHGQKYLLFSFHGIPQQCIDRGDPYEKYCHASAELIAAALQLTPKEWSIAFQSRLGPTTWIKPYTDNVLADLPQQNVRAIQVVCPGFPADCLETLEEIALRGKEQFMLAGGDSYEYIPALNNSPLHIDALTQIIHKFAAMK